MYHVPADNRRRLNDAFPVTHTHPLDLVDGPGCAVIVTEIDAIGAVAVQVGHGAP